jgi:hypothetical protein
MIVHDNNQVIAPIVGLVPMVGDHGMTVAGHPPVAVFLHMVDYTEGGLEMVAFDSAVVESHHFG